jgi:calcineurin-like phosphoesterase family protein
VGVITITYCPGKAQEIILRSKATVKKIDFLNQSMMNQKGDIAARYNIAEMYIQALSKLEGKNILIKGEVNDPKEMVRQALNIIDMRSGLSDLRDQENK